MGMAVAKHEMPLEPFLSLSLSLRWRGMRGGTRLVDGTYRIKSRPVARPKLVRARTGHVVDVYNSQARLGGALIRRILPIEEMEQQADGILQVRLYIHL